MSDDWRQGGFGVYIHWPYCLAKCPYCDFNSHVSNEVNHAHWRAALLSELRYTASLTGPRRVDSVFFGGGTPSLMEAKTVSALIEEIDRLWGLKPGAEITLEANPTSVEADKFADFSIAGVNRISMGIQSLNDDALRSLGRMHSVSEALSAFEIAKKQFSKVSFDLIYARQRQTAKAWFSELEQALELAVDHLSLYQLTIENGTRFGELFKRGKLRGLPEDDAAADMYIGTQQVCADYGLLPYEISNYAKLGAESRHNLIYWRYGDYAGIGPGAHARLTLDGQKTAMHTEKNPAKWLKMIEKYGNGYFPSEVLNPEDQGIEYLMMSMRLTEGSDMRRFESLSGTGVSASKIQNLENMGMIHNRNGRLIATEKGRPLLNSILSELLA
ncbi:MAG: radical SAM family heme chaperone HemW [Rhodobacteraceae bacterium]|nr:radical SAM family heme chaperone HemW [Paracoccaceae bacterium]